MAGESATATPRPRSVGDKLKALQPPRRTHHGSARSVPKHKINQADVLSRPMSVVARSAWRPVLHDVQLMQKRAGAIVDQKVAVVTFVAERVVLERLCGGVVGLVVGGENRRVQRSVAPPRLRPAGCPCIVVVAIRAGDNTGGTIARFKASHGRVLAGGCHRVERRVAEADLQADVSNVVLPHNPAGCLVPDSVTLQAYFVFVICLADGTPGNGYA